MKQRFSGPGMKPEQSAGYGRAEPRMHPMWTTDLARFRPTLGGAGRLVRDAIAAPLVLIKFVALALVGATLGLASFVSLVCVALAPLVALILALRLFGLV